jgi:hypothetical protein
VSFAVVVPTNRPEQFSVFLEAWEDLFVKHDVYLIVVQDSPEHMDIMLPCEGEAHTWSSIKADGIPHKTDMIRSWGIYRAWITGRYSDYTLTLDDDTRPDSDIFEAYQRVFTEGAVCSEYLDVGSLTSYGKPLRGFPYRDRERKPVAVQYGGWNGVLDYDAPTQLAGVEDVEMFCPVVVPVPRGVPVTGCIMNACWRTQYAPIMWQLPLFEGRYNRFGDIWAGLFAKKTLDATGDVMVINGEASVRHERASNAWANLERETPGIPVNEDIWGKLAAYGGGDLLDVYRRVTDSAHNYFDMIDPAYATHFKRSRDEWLALFA